MALRAASSDASEKKNITGYVHSVSPIKVPKNPNSSRYFDFQLQEGQEFTRVVCFNAAIHDEVKQKEDAKLPVSLTNISPSKRKFSDEMEYKLNKSSRLCAAKNLAFQWQDLGTPPNTTVEEIMNNKGEGQTIDNLKAKVLLKGSTDTVFSRNLQKELKKCSIVVADATGFIPITVWEEYIEKVVVDHCYSFTNLVVSTYQKKHLNTTRSTAVTDANPEDVVVSEEIASEATEITEDTSEETETVSGRIIAVTIQRMYTCINCKFKLPELPGKTAYKCTKCKLTMLREDLLSTNSGNGLIKNDVGELVGRYFLPHNVIQSLFDSLSEMNVYSIEKGAILSVDMMEETLINLKQLQFEIIKDKKIVKSLKHV